MRCLYLQEKITVLGLDHVKIAFLIYVSGLFLAVFAFVMEAILGGGKSGRMRKVHQKIQAW